MAGPCAADFEALAARLGGFGCDGANPILNLHDPFGLDHWSLLVIEVATLVGAVLALRHAIRRRRQGDPTVLSIWLAAVAYLVIVEPPLYFPEQFGLQDQVGLIFVHNQFTVQFLYDRLPLYIVSIYPVMAVLAYELVRVVGVFERRGPVASAVTVGFVYHVFYEIFDHVGPQLQWWIWNPTAPTNEPFLASVPVSSMVNFALAGPIALTLLVRLLVARHPDAAAMGTPTLVARSALVGVLMPLGLVLGGLPATVFTLGGTTNHTAQGVAYWTMLALAGAVAVVSLLDAHRSTTDRARDPGADRYLATHASVYLGALAVAWGAALPAYLQATNGITEAGTPIGSLPYAVACLVGALALLWLARPTRAAAPDPATGQPAARSSGRSMTASGRARPSRSS